MGNRPAAIGPLPPEDRSLSSRTGWTRAHWEHVADVLLQGVRPYASARHSLIHPPGPLKSPRDRRGDGLEGFARTFLLAAFRLAGGSPPPDLADWYAAGLEAGTRPGGAESWPVIRDRSQALVEAAFIATALAESRSSIWDRLPDAVQESTVEWLSGVRGKQPWRNNWVLFQVIVNAFLKSVGAPYEQAEIDGNLDLVDSWYRRDGWYTDGAGRRYDYYGGWAMHFYTLLWCRIDGSCSAPDRADVYRRRLRRFLEQYRYFFSADGAPLYHGRSLVYRLATVAPIWLGALLDATPLDPGETRRIASGTLKHFVERGAIKDGVLSAGWYGPFPPMVQPYSGHGSPYWGSKGFLGLLIPSDNAVWTAPEALMPVERGDFCVAMPEPGFLALGTQRDGIVRVANHGSDHFPLRVRQPTVTPRQRVARRFKRVIRVATEDPRPLDDAHYRKLAYSTHTGPDLSVEADECDLDSQFTLLNDGRRVSRRARLYPLVVADRFAASVFYPSEPRLTDRVETVSIALGPAELRVHHVSSERGTGVREGGFALAGDDRPEMATGDYWAWVRRDDGLTSFIGALYGYESAGVRTFTAANAFGPRSSTPYVSSSRPVKGEAVYVSINVLQRNDRQPEESLGLVESLGVHGRQVDVVCRNGERFLVQLVAPEWIEDAAAGSGYIRLARVSSDGSVVTVMS